MNRCHNPCGIKCLISSFILGALIVLFYYKYCIEQEMQNTGSSIRENIENATVPNTKRSKRFIIFSGSGVVKFVLGTSFPIILADKKRSLNNFYNFQMQYTPAPVPLYWWSFYNTTTFAERKQRSASMLMHFDNSRASVYELIETIFQSSSGNSNNECLLKVICEMARAPLSDDFVQRHHGDYGGQDHHHYNYDNNDEDEVDDYDVRHEYPIDDDYGRNIYHRLINAIFTPHLRNVEERYWIAHTTGSSGGNCDELYGKCSIIDDWFQRFTRML